MLFLDGDKMKLGSSGQMREIDNFAINELGIPSTLLMTNAAGHVARAAMRLLGENKTAAVFCGSGNNVGDGIAAATYMIKHGITVRVFLAGKREKMTEDTGEMERRLNEAGGIVESYNIFSPDIREYVLSCGVIIDALFGIGLNDNLREPAVSAVSLINISDAPVVSADIASGVSADTGEIMGDCVKADVTVTFSLPKPGHFIEPGGVCCGELKIVDIGISQDLINDLQVNNFVVMEGEVSLPKRRRDTHKGNYGRDLIIAGSVGYTGAPCLAANAASRSGAGLVFLGVPERIYQIAAVKCDEVMPFPLPCDADGKLSDKASEEIISRAKNCDVCLIGPGLGRSDSIDHIVEQVLKNVQIPVVIDADGINAAAKNINILHEATCPVIMTPHAGEFSRLGGDLIGLGRLESARIFAMARGCTLVLKGHRTITAFPDGTVYVNTTGGPGMAKGGSGDVLAGMIASFIGQGLQEKFAVIAAVFLHGKAGDMCAEKFGEYSMTATDIIDMLAETTK